MARILCLHGGRYDRVVTGSGLGFPIVRICALISLATGSVRDYAYAPYEGKGTGEA